MKRQTKQTEQADLLELVDLPEQPGLPGQAPAQYVVNHRFGLNLRADASKAAPIVRVLGFNEVIIACGDAIEVDGVKWLPVAGGYVVAAYLRLMEG